MKKIFLSIYIILTHLVSGLPLLWLFYFLQFPEDGSGNAIDVIFNAGIFLAWAFIHSLLTLEGSRKVMAGIFGGDYVRSIYAIIAGITLAAVLILWRPLPGELWRFSGVLYWIFTILYMAALLTMGYNLLLMDYLGFAGTRDLIMKLLNRAPKPPVFTVKGLYAYCRHPIYLFFIISLWTGPVMTSGRLEFAVLGTLYFIMGSFHEERNLIKELGDEYAVYKKNVPMLIPRLTPWKHKS